MHGAVGVIVVADGITGNLLLQQEKHLGDDKGTDSVMCPCPRHLGHFADDVAFVGWLMCGTMTLFIQSSSVI